MRKCCLTWTSIQFFFTQGSETHLRPQRNNLYWPLAVASTSHRSLSVLFMSTQRLYRNYCSQQIFVRKKRFCFGYGVWRGLALPSGTFSCHAFAGLRASPNGGHEEVDGSASKEWEGVFSADAPHGCHGREAGPASAQCRTGLHQPAEQGEL